MTQRIQALTLYLFRTLFFSLTGLIYLILTLLYWIVFFPPGQVTPDIDNYIIIIGAWGAFATFLITLSMAARANEAGHYPFIVRLPSKVEYLTAVLFSSLIYTLILQILLAILALYAGPELNNNQLLNIPPIWIAIDILAAVMAIHASDFATAGWSRIYVYGTLALLLLGQNANELLSRWLGGRIQTLSRFFLERNLTDLGDTFRNWSIWFNDEGIETIGQLFGFVFWPFRAIVEAVIGGSFNPSQALAPAILLLYAAILFMLAADLFANKDLDFTE